MGKSNIAILMATYNGERHLEEQLDSLMRQSVKDWTLYVHDDGSTDGTPALLARYAANHPQVRVLDYESQHGACANFLSLLRRVEADYYLFCDQDDVWDPDKVRMSLDEMRRQEKEAPGKPVVVHTDLLVVDERLQVIDTSYLRYTHLNPQRMGTFAQAVVPFVTGCAMCFNQAARQNALSRPATAATMHDAWVTAATMSQDGVVALIPRPLVSYRQHGANAVGAREVSKVGLGYRLRHLRDIIGDNAAHYRMLRQWGYGSPLKFVWQRMRFTLASHFGQ